MANRFHSLPRPSIRFGQNFLKSASLIDDLIRNKTSLNAADTVYEIGPGRGIITDVLAKVCGKVVAIELEPRFFAQLRQQFAQCKNVETVQADVLKFDFPTAPYKICSNIPFNITADIFRKLFLSNNPPATAYLILQRAAAEKYSGAGGERQASLLLKPWYEMRILHEFRRSDFEPMPAVDVVFLQIQRRSTQPLVSSSDAELYRKFIIYSFSRHNAHLSKSLKKVFSYLQWKRLAHDMRFGIHEQPTDLNFEQWLGLFRFFSEGLKNGVIKPPQDLLTPAAAPQSNLDRRQGHRAQRWKNRKARQKR